MKPIRNYRNIGKNFVCSRWNVVFDYGNMIRNDYTEENVFTPVGENIKAYKSSVDVVQQLFQQNSIGFFNAVLILDNEVPLSKSHTIKLEDNLYSIIEITEINVGLKRVYVRLK